MAPVFIAILLFILFAILLQPPKANNLLLLVAGTAVGLFYLLFVLPKALRIVGRIWKIRNNLPKGFPKTISLK